MLRSRKMAISAVIGLVGLAPMGVFADGASIAKDKCADCHTESGNSKDEKVPNIAGFSAVTIEDMMTSFREGDREGRKYKPENGDETDMNHIAKDLSEDDVKAVAEYYSKKQFEKHANTTDPELAKKGKKLHDKKCEKCHSDGGTNAEDDAAILSGQWMAYLKKEFDDIAAEKRVVPKKMRKKFQKLDEKEREALLNYYAAGKP